MKKLLIENFFKRIATSCLSAPWTALRRKPKSCAFFALMSASALLGSCGGGSGASGGSGPPAPATYVISGQVQSPSSVTVNLSGTESAVTTTDASGNYSFNGLISGSYTVSPSQSGTVFAPVQTTVTIQGASSTAPVFVASTAADSLPDTTLDAVDALPESPLALTEMRNADGTSVADYLASRGIILPTAPSQLSIEAPTNLSEALPDDVKMSMRHINQTIALPPASNATQRKQDVIDTMVGVATFLGCGRATPPCTSWNFSADSTSPVTHPAQKGLAYVYGGKTPSVRTLPVDGCPQYLYGVDCSGLISVIATYVGMTAPNGSAAQADPSNWSIPPDWGLTLTTVTDGSQAIGDLVVWNGHIGILTTAPGVVNVISSTGKAGECTKNANPPRGPRSLSLASLANSGLGQPTTVLRLTAGGFWQGTYQITTCTTPGSVVSGSLYCNAVMEWPNGGLYNYGTISFRTDTSEKHNFRRDYTVGGSITNSICKADSIPINHNQTTSSFTESIFSENGYGTAGSYAANTVTYSITSSTPQAISGTFTAPVPYQNAQTGNNSDWVEGTLQGTWQASPLAAAFPKCVPPTGDITLYCTDLGISSIPPDGTRVACPWVPVSSPAPPGEWQGLP